MDELTAVTGHIGSVNAQDQIVLRGICPFCHDRVTFRQRACTMLPNEVKGLMVSIQCEGCNAMLSYSIKEHKLYPQPELSGLKDLPKEIQKYYDEALRCISSDCPNGAVTLFRKIIHAVGIYYSLAKKNDSKNIYTIIKELHTKGHIVKKLQDALLGIKDIGNDGAHINDNEPDMGQAKLILRLIDTVLKSTIVCDSELAYVKKLHDNKNKNEKNEEILETE